MIDVPSRGASPRQLLEFRRTVRQTASLIASEVRVREKPGPIWAADIDAGIVYWNHIDPVSDSILTRGELLMNISHEAAHLNWTGHWNMPDELAKQRASREMLRRFMNACEDIRIERLLSREFPGFEQIRESSNLRALGWQEPMLRHMCETDRVSFGYLRREVGMSLDPLTKEEQKFVEDTWSQISAACNLPDTRSMSDVVVPIFLELLGEREPDEQEQLQQKDKQKPSRSRPSDESVPGSMNMREQLESLRGDMKRRNVRESMIQKLEEMLDRIDEASESDLGPTLLETKDVPGLSSAQYFNPLDWDSHADSLRPLISRLSRKLQTVLRSNRADDWCSGLRRGSFDASAAHRAVAGARNVFRDRTEPGEVDYAFMLGMDVSGSQNERRKEIMDAVVLFVEAVERAGMSAALVTWSHVMHSQKPFAGRVDEETKTLIGRDIGWCGGGTYEAPSLTYASEQFSRVGKNGTRVFIQVTDGQTHSPSHSREMIDELEQMDVRCIGIGIDCKAPAHYEDGHSFVSAHDLVELLPKIIAASVHKGR